MLPNDSAAFAPAIPGRVHQDVTQGMKGNITPKDICHCCGGDYLWCWEEAFYKFGFGDGDSQIETAQVEEVLVEAGYAVVSSKWGLHNLIVTSITKDGQEIMPSEDTQVCIGYDDPRTYLPQSIIDLLDEKLPADGAESPF